jgi:hypothetical protein
MAFSTCRWCFLLGLIVTATGCQTFGGKGSEDSMSGGPPKQSEPKIDEPGDKWGYVGKEARGSRPLEDEHDPFKPFLMSDQARAIERNLGYK